MLQHGVICDTEVKKINRSAWDRTVALRKLADSGMRVRPSTSLAGLHSGDDIKNLSSSDSDYPSASSQPFEVVAHATPRDGAAPGERIILAAPTPATRHTAAGAPRVPDPEAGAGDPDAGAGGDGGPPGRGPSTSTQTSVQLQFY